MKFFASKNGQERCLYGEKNAPLDGEQKFLLTDVELIQAVLQGNPEAFTPLIRRYEYVVRAIAAAILGDWDEAQDAAQDAFYKAYENLAALKKPETFRWWLFQIARRQALTLRKEKSKYVRLNRPVAVSAPISRAQLHEETRLLLQAVSKLPRQQQLVVMLRHFDGHSEEEIAEIIGSSRGAVTKLLARAYKNLKVYCKDWIDESGK